MKGLAKIAKENGYEIWENWWQLNVGYGIFIQDLKTGAIGGYIEFTYEEAREKIVDFFNTIKKLNKEGK